MMSRTVAPLLCLALAAPAAATLPMPASVHATPLSPAERSALAFHAAPKLAALRAGDVDGRTRLQADQRASLRAAEAQSHELRGMRAGGAVTTILIIVAVVLLILILV